MAVSTSAYKTGGFTLVELLVTLSIAAILLALAAPQLQTLMLNGRRTALANDFILALTYAKSEAVKRGVRVSVCSRAANATATCATIAGTSNIGWTTGWLIFVDNNGDGTVNGTDLVLQAYPALPSGNTLVAGARKFVTFLNTGVVAAVNNDTFRLCDRLGTAQGRAIVVSPQGRMRTDSLVSQSRTCP